VAGRDTPQAWLSSTVKSLETEVDSGRPGAGAVAARLADILLIQAVRAHLASAAPEYRGWLRGIVDPRVSRALSCIHARPERRWSVAALAEVSGMSRSRFAERFQEIIGRTPSTNLTHWRMYTAAGALISGGVSLTEMAEKAGYKSEVAFSKAFKRWGGCSPGCL
jgi:transcriptional regulator GlxA family with amidase domain